jgi:hypothetical protein
MKMLEVYGCRVQVRGYDPYELAENMAMMTRVEIGKAQRNNPELRAKLGDVPKVAVLCT